MGKAFDNWDDLEKYLKKTIDNILENEMAKQVKDEMQTAISDVVYDAGTPKKYVRRGNNEFGRMGNTDGTGSLADKREMPHTVKDGLLEVANDAERNKKYDFAGKGYDTSKSLAENIISGYGDRDDWYNEPRDFIGETVKNIKSSKSHIKVMKEALIDKGFNVL
ncbi:MAG: hypothetical protein PHN69_05150 [Candidatus Pacebacteria bacterium]|nr:hypothetical protein [Candidatus Paceibacterota bacterium]